MTDHYFDMPTLEQMGASVRDGKPLRLDPQTCAELIEQIRSSGMVAKLQELSGGNAGAQESAEKERPPPKKPWWKFW